MSFVHVKGHQDQSVITVLPLLAWMNIEMDLLTKNKLLSAEPYKHMNKIPYMGWICRIVGNQIIKHLSMALH